MQLAERQTVIETSGVKASTTYDIKTKNMSKIMGLLRDCYSDKELAILREYACNGHDSHVMAGHPHRPIRVTLPTPFDQTLRIRDFGTGLSEWEVMNVFASYGESTKDNTNDQIGALGIGSKSAFAYANEFTVTSFLNGERTLYCSYMDESGAGKMDKLGDTEPTDEENGIEISLRVNPNDIKTFHQAAKKCYRHFHPMPEILGSQEVADFLNINRKEPVFKGAGWKMFETDNGYDAQVHVLMGNILYPVDLSIVVNRNDKPELSWVYGCHHKELLLEANIGEVFFAPSREALTYDPKTKTFILDHIKAVYHELKAAIEKDIASAPNLWEARKLLANRKEIVGHIKFKPLYKGKEIEDTYVTKNELSSMNVTLRSYKRHSLRFESQDIIRPDQSPVLLCYHGDFPESQLVKRARFYIQGRIKDDIGRVQKHNYILVRPNFTGRPAIPAKAAIPAVPAVPGIPFSKIMADFMVNPSIVGATFVNLNTVILPKIVRPKVARKTAEDKSKVSVFKYKGTVGNPKSGNWENALIDPNIVATYVQIEFFQPRNGLNWLQSQVVRYRNITGKDLVVYGVRKNVIVPTTWKTVDEVVKEALLVAIKDPEVLTVRQQQAADKALPNHFKELAGQPELYGNGDLAILLNKAQSVKITQEMRVKAESVSILAKYFGLTLQDPIDQFSKDCELITKKYRALDLYCGGRTVTHEYVNTKDWHNEIKAYIAYVDTGKI